MPVNRKNNHHNDRINQEISRELTGILRNIKDPRVSGAFISIMRTETTPDLKICKVHYSLMSGDAKEVKQGLSSACGFIRKELAMRLNLRNTPALTFVHDNSIEHGVHIAKLIDDVMKKNDNADE